MSSSFSLSSFNCFWYSLTWLMNRRQPSFLLVERSDVLVQVGEGLLGRPPLIADKGEGPSQDQDGYEKTTLFRRVRGNSRFRPQATATKNSSPCGRLFRS